MNVNEASLRIPSQRRRKLRSLQNSRHKYFLCLILVPIVHEIDYIISVSAHRSEHFLLLDPIRSLSLCSFVVLEYMTILPYLTGYNVFNVRVPQGFEDQTALRIRLYWSAKEGLSTLLQTLNSDRLTQGQVDGRDTGCS